MKVIVENDNITLSVKDRKVTIASDSIKMVYNTMLAAGFDRETILASMEQFIQEQRG